MRLLGSLAIFQLLITVAFGWKVYHLGKFWGPKLEARPTQEFADLWFDQKLDHFDPTNGDTWKQVPHLFMATIKIFHFIYTLTNDSK